MPVGDLAKVAQWMRHKKPGILVLDGRAYLVRPGHEPLTRRLRGQVPEIGTWRRVQLD